MHPSETELFERERSTLLSIAYRMLGERSLAEDIVQDAWVKWSTQEQDKIRHPSAWLKRVTSRLAMDELRSAHQRREQYVGPWLPEPFPDSGERRIDPQPEDALALASECELALLWAMERLSVEERAAFILRKAFDTDYAEIARVLHKTEGASRKLVSRASRRVQQAKPKFAVDRSEITRMLRRFSSACLSGDQQTIADLLAPEVIALTDGGGKVRAALRPLHGIEEVSGVIAALAKKFPGAENTRFITVNGMPAIQICGTPEQDMISTIRMNRQGLIDWIYVMRNPDKLPQLPNPGITHYTSDN